MAIRKVEVDEYTSGGKVIPGRLIVSEFDGRMILTIYDPDQEREVGQVEVYADDVWRAWQAVKRH